MKKKVHGIIALVIIVALICSSFAIFLIPQEQEWKWYENKEWRYRIKYPADWEVTEKSENFTYFYPPRYKKVHCDIFINKGENIESMVITGNETGQETKKEKLNMSELSNFNLDDVPAFRTKFANEQIAGIIIFAEKDDFFIIFTFLYL
jgi:hypothetical protein